MRRSVLLILCLLLCLSCANVGTGQEAGLSSPAPADTQVPDPTAAPSQTPQTEPPAAVPDGQSAAVPDETPAPTVAPISDGDLDAGALDAWFEGSVMIGDSLVSGLSAYVLSETDKGHVCLDGMQLVGASALTLKKAAAAERHEREAELKFRKHYLTASEIVDEVQAKRLFIMLGVSNLRWFGIDELIEVYGQFIDAVRADHPDLKIYVHSLMPMVKDYAAQVGVDYETNKAANERLRAFCEEHGYVYLELADLVRDGDGYLKYEYSAQDYRFHLNNAGKAIWVRLLRSCARDEYYAGTWKPEDH